MPSRNPPQITDEKDPCAEESRASLKCLSRTNYDLKNRDACQPYFDNYNNCKKFWLGVQKARRVKGISPLLPPLCERGYIKEKYQETGRYPNKGVPQTGEIPATAEG